MKNVWKMPRIYALGPIDDDTDTGEGSAQSGFEPWACNYDEWLELFADEDATSYEDYVKWWQDNGFAGEPYPEP